jgi:hypothetical protein
MRFHMLSEEVQQRVCCCDIALASVLRQSDLTVWPNLSANAKRPTEEVNVSELHRACFTDAEASKGSDSGDGTERWIERTKKRTDLVLGRNDHRGGLTSSSGQGDAIGRVVADDTILRR